VVDASLRVQGYANVWALGDCASVPTSDGTPCPPTAQHATRQAHLIAENIAATLAGKKLRPFDFEGLGKMGSLGRRNAVAEIFGLSISGFLACSTVTTARADGCGPDHVRRLRGSDQGPGRGGGARLLPASTTPRSPSGEGTGYRPMTVTRGA
jgi:hypothetical protein